MYLLFGILVLICVFFFLLNFWRRRRIIRRLCGMDFCEKVRTLNEILNPFGFSYSSGQDVITSMVDAWQREFGYRSLFDKSAVHFNMVFDCEPIYFNYQNRTWLIEFWKGQYGVSLGSEVGIYYADSLLSPGQYDRSLFHSVPDSLLLPVSMELYQNGKRLFSLNQSHWWLTGFCPGRYGEPEDLSAEISVTCPDYEMLQGFIQGLFQAGYRRKDLCICNLTVTLTFSRPYARQPRRHFRFRTAFAQWKNRRFCFLYRLITRPFSCTLDQILYLYYFLPYTFRHMLRFRRNRKQRPGRRHRKY